MCDCGPDNKRTYYANVQLYTDKQEGLVSGAASPLAMKEVTVCTKCGHAEFSIAESEKRFFRVA